MPLLAKQRLPNAGFENESQETVQRMFLPDSALYALIPATKDI